MNKNIFLDVETTGLDSQRCQILTCGVILEKDGAVIVEKEFTIQKENWSLVQQAALDCNGINLEEHKGLTEKEFIDEFKKLLFLHEMEKAVPCGHNVSFDLGFLSAAFRRHNERYPLHYHVNDTMVLARMLKHTGILAVPSVKLTTLSEHFGIIHDAHKALADTIVTRQVYYKLMSLVQKSRG